MTDRELINMAFTAMKQAYSPYSGFTVGAALECEDGSMFIRCLFHASAGNFSPISLHNSQKLLKFAIEKC